MKILDAIKLAAARPDKPETAAQLRKAIDAVDIPRLEEVWSALKVERDRVLLDGTDADVFKLDASIAAARLQVERADVAKRTLGARLVEAEAREVREAGAAKREEARAMSAAAVTAMQKDLPDAYRAIRRVLRQMADATAACDAVNMGAPHEDRVQSPDDWRAANRVLPEVVIKRKTVSLWAMKGSPETPLSAADQARVIPRTANTGSLPDDRKYAPGMLQHPSELVLRQYVRVERLRRVEGEWLSPFADTLRLPPIASGELAGWEMPQYGTDQETGMLRVLSMRETLDALESAAAAGPARDGRKPEVVFELVPEPATAEAA